MSAETATELNPTEDGMDDFNAGFADNLTASPTATPAAQTDEQTQDEAPTTPQEAQPEPEPAPEYAQLTRAERDELMALREQATKQFGTAFGKIGGIERRLQEWQNGAQVEISQDDIDAVKDDFPPLAAALEKVRNMRVLPGTVDQERIDALVTQRVQEAERKSELRFLSMVHPDWQAVDSSPEFQSWFAAQPDEYKQQLVQASKAYDSVTVSAAMTAFKQSRSKPAAPATSAAADAASARRSRKEAAVTPRGVGGQAAPNALDDLMAGYNE